MSFAPSVVISNEEFVPPGPGDFELPDVFTIAGVGVTKPMLQLVLAGVIIFGILYLASRKRAMVPGRLQFAGESAYGFVRNSVARDIIGSRDFMRFVPYLVTVFSFILLNNLFGSIPFIQFPTFSRSGMVYGLAALSWIVYNYVGIRKHGFLGYLKLQCVPGGIKGPILVLLVPLEFMSNLIVRPVTLALRLFANMFAGHILIAVFTIATWYLFQAGIGLLFSATSFVLTIALTMFELLIQVLQAYIFTILTAQYIGGAWEAAH